MLSKAYSGLMILIESGMSQREFGIFIIGLAAGLMIAGIVSIAAGLAHS